jgi:mRNA interferase MazF
VTRGEIWWARGEAGRRPYLILTRSVAIPLLVHVVVAPLTRTARGIPSEVPVGLDDGLPEACVVSFDNITTLRRSRFVERICTLSPARMRDVCRALRIAVDC